MYLLRFLLLLQLATTLALGQAVHQTEPAIPANQPEALVRRLYQQVIAHQPVGFPEDGDMKIFAPYLSKALLHRIDLSVACLDDWYRQNPQPDMKPDVGWLELGYFSGDNERATPQNFVIEKTAPQKDGSFRVYVRLTRTFPDAPPSIWHVAAVVIRENGHLAVGDIVYLKDADYPQGRLASALSSGCDGRRWVGFGNGRNDSK